MANLGSGPAVGLPQPYTFQCNVTASNTSVVTNTPVRNPFAMPQAAGLVERNGFPSLYGSKFVPGRTATPSEWIASQPTTLGVACSGTSSSLVKEETDVVQTCPQPGMSPIGLPLTTHPSTIPL